MGALPLRPANRTSFGQQLKAAKEQQLKELRNANQNKRRRSWEIEINPVKPAENKAAKTQAQLLANKEKAELQQKFRDDARRERERIKEEKNREKLRAKAAKKVALLDNVNMNKGYSAPKSHRGNDRIFKTIPFTKEGKIEVRIDERTVIYVREGDDIEAAKQKILNRHDQYKNQQKARLEGKNAAMRDFE